jgi:hypothetical protein
MIYSLNCQTMKKCYLIFLLILSQRISFASVPDTIPNAGFERWLNVTWYDNPEAWFTNNNSLLAPGVSMDSNAYSGYLAVKLANVGALVPELWTGFPLTTRPFNLGGYYKKDIRSNDSVVISVHLYLNHILVDNGTSIEYTGSTSGYVPFIIPISQNLAVADSCDISIVGGTVFASEISFDNLEFDFSLGIPPVEKFSFSVYPNPCTENLIVQSNFSEKEKFNIEAYDVLGKKEYLTDEVLDNSITVDYIVNPEDMRRVFNISKLHNGVWILIFRSKEQSYTTRLIKN